jgi:hypothetical protein
MVASHAVMVIANTARAAVAMACFGVGDFGPLRETFGSGGVGSLRRRATGVPPASSDVAVAGCLAQAPERTRISILAWLDSLH